MRTRSAAPSVLRYGAAVVLGAAGPVARVLAGGRSSWPTALALVVLAVATTTVLGAGSRPHALVVRALAVVAAGAVGAAAVGVGFLIPAATVVLGTALAHGACVAWRPLPGWRQRTTPVANLAVAPLVLSALSWYRRGSVVVELGFAVATVLLLELHARAPRAVAAVDRGVQRVAAAVAHALALVLSTAAWVLAVLPTWALSRATRYDPLDPGWAGPRTAWVTFPSAGSADAAARAGLVDLAPSPAVRRRGRWRLAPVVVVVGGLVGLVVADRLGSPTSTAEAPAMDLRGTPTGAPRVPDDQLQWAGFPVTDYAHEEEPFARDLFRELLETRPTPDLMLGSRNRDVSGRYVNVVDGRRATWTPADPTLTVWYFGGSTMYGIGQRDDHTIPSLVSKLAARDGIRVQALNFGVSGDVNWVETVRFAEALGSDLPRPDLVVFYDGWNDNSLGFSRAAEGDTRPQELTRWPVSDRERELQQQGIGGTPRPAGPELAAAQVELASSQYRSGVATVRSLAAAHGVPVLFFWQPFAALKAPSPADRELYRRIDFRPEWREDAVRTYQAIKERSGVDPIDVSTVFDGVDRPVYFDQGHTNEYGAELVAAELYRTLGPRLRSLDERR